MSQKFASSELNEAIFFFIWIVDDLLLVVCQSYRLIVFIHGEHAEIKFCSNTLYYAMSTNIYFKHISHLPSQRYDCHGSDTEFLHFIHDYHYTSMIIGCIRIHHCISIIINVDTTKFCHNLLSNPIFLISNFNHVSYLI